MSFYKRFSVRTAGLALLTWLFVALVLHLRAEHSIQRDRTTVGSTITHDLGTTKPPLSAGSSRPEASIADKTLNGHAGNGTRRTAVVVAKTASEDATWLDDYFPQWEKNIYSVGDRNAKLKIPKNKGRESMVYLR